MSSKPQDAATQTAASAGAQQNDATLDANAAQNQAFANQSRSTLFGTYNPATNKYTGGTESGLLDPASTTSSILAGPYAQAYTNTANTNAQGAQRAVQTSQMQGNNMGQGKTPIGYQADQARQAYQQQAANNGNAYAGLFGQQHTDALNQYNNANSMLSNNSTGAGTQALTGNTAAAGNYANLYGTASNQKVNPITGTINTLATAGLVG